MTNKQLPPQPEIKDFTDVEIPVTNDLTLSNGIKLRIINRGDQEVNRIDFIFNGGTFDQKQPMVATAMPMMLRHGGGKHTSKEIAEKLDFYGAWIQGRGYDHHTSLTIYSINRWFKEILAIAEAIIKTPTFPQHEFDVIKTQLVSNLSQSKEQVKYLASKEFNRMFFGSNHPLGRNIDETEIEQLSTTMLANFHSSFYKPENCTILLSGVITEEMIAIVDQHFGGKWKSNNTKEHIADNNNVVHDNNKFSIINKTDAIQAAVIMGLEAIPRTHPHYIPLRILVVAFGGYFGSRLMSNIREDKGYTYGISAGLIGRKDMSYIQIASECATEYTHLLVEEVKTEINKLKTQILEEEELSRVKSFLLSDLVKTSDTPFSIADYIVTSITCDIPDDYFANQVTIITNITPQEILQIANKYFHTEKLFIAIAGDKNLFESFSF